MKKFEIAINERVIEAINYLLSSKTEPNKAKLADNMGVKPAKFSEILNGRMKAGMDIIQKLCIDYKVSADWLITGDGSMFRTPAVMDEAPPLDRDEVVRLLREKVADQQRIIDLLDEKLEAVMAGGNTGTEIVSAAG
jgi:transcriptional regulator with XRE-family HTH domain